MKRTFLFQLFGFIIVTGLILGLTGIHPVLAAEEDQADLTLADLGMTSQQILTGPISEYSLRFNLPVEWAAEGTAAMDVELSAFFSSLVASESTDAVSGLVGGNLSLYLNDTLLGITTLTQPGQQTLHFEFDARLFQAATRDSINVLRMVWDGSISCSMNLLSSVTISPTSTLKIAHRVNPGDLTLNDFPVPFIIENSIEVVPLIVVLPDSPSAGELRAAMILAAGVGQISKGSKTVELVSLSKYHPSTSASQNVMLVANSDTLKTMALTNLGITEGLQSAEGEGLLHFFTPQGGYGLLVSGDEAGIVKAAQVAGAGQVIAGGNTQTMLVSGVNPSASTLDLEDMTLEDLGSGELVFTRPDHLAQSVDFFVPAGNQVRADASFELIVSHSQQLDYMSSGLQVKVNGYPAVSLRLTDNTSNQSVFRLILPANLIHVGRNKVEFVADLNTRSICTPPLETVAWLRVSSSSLLHLPLESAVSGSPLARTFKDFPDAFLAGSGLNDITLVIAPAEFGNLQAAATLAGELGAAQPDQPLLQLNAIFSDSAETAKAAESSMILVGKPSDFPGLSDRSQFPSLAFNADNSLSSTSALQLVSESATGADVGYLAIRGFDALSNRILMAVLGNTNAGLGYAVDAVTGKDAAANNFVMVVDPNVQTGWLDDGIATGELVQAQPEPIPTAEAVNPVQIFKIGMLKWVIPVLAFMLAVMLFFIYVEIRQNMRKTK